MDVTPSDSSVAAAVRRLVTAVEARLRQDPSLLRFDEGVERELLFDIAVHNSHVHVHIGIDLRAG